MKIFLLKKYNGILIILFLALILRVVLYLILNVNDNPNSDFYLHVFSATSDANGYQQIALNLMNTGSFAGDSITYFCILFNYIPDFLLPIYSLWYFLTVKSKRIFLVIFINWTNIIFHIFNGGWRFPKISNTGSPILFNTYCLWIFKFFCEIEIIIGYKKTIFSHLR